MDSHELTHPPVISLTGIYSNTRLHSCALSFAAGSSRSELEQQAAAKLIGEALPLSALVNLIHVMIIFVISTFAPVQIEGLQWRVMRLVISSAKCTQYRCNSVLPVLDCGVMLFSSRGLPVRVSSPLLWPGMISLAQLPRGFLLLPDHCMPYHLIAVQQWQGLMLSHNLVWTIGSYMQ